MAIVNYSQAIKLNPDDADVYYNRAALFEEVLLNDSTNFLIYLSSVRPVYFFPVSDEWRIA